MNSQSNNSQTHNNRSNIAMIFLTLAALVSFLILVGLGTWQLQRMVWKQDLLAQIAERKILPPLTEINADTQADDILYRTAAVTGHWRHETEIALQPRIVDGKVGVHIVTLFETPQGLLLAVNRGWTNNRAEIERSNDEHVLVGRIMPPPRRNAFTPDNDPVSMNFYWYEADYYSEEFDNFYADILLYALDESEEQDGLLIGSQERIDLPDNHRSYMIFWYFMALLLVLFYGIILRRHLIETKQEG